MTTPTVAVLDSNGIIGLAKADCFTLLQHLFAEICVPQAVVAEITDQLSQSPVMKSCDGARCDSESVRLMLHIVFSFSLREASLLQPSRISIKCGC